MGITIMKTNFDKLRDRLHAKAGIIEEETGKHSGKSFADIHKDQCEDGFCTLMDNRLVMGHLRYGSSSKKRPQFYYIKRLQTEITHYLQSGNTEYLVNAANYARLEFKKPSHSKAHFHAVDRD